jgi:hypothetical protein
MRRRVQKKWIKLAKPKFTMAAVRCGAGVIMWGKTHRGKG